MRIALAVFVLLPVLAFAAGKQEVYKWVDDKGVVHYTDKPPSENAKPAKLPPLQTYKGGAVPADLNKFARPTGRAPAEPAGSAQLQLVTPAADETFHTGARTVPVAVIVTPELAPGQQLIYLLDGVPQATPTTSTSFDLTNVERGTHSVSVTLVDASGQTLGQSNSVTFYMQPPSAVPRSADSAPTAPGIPRKPPPKPTPKP